MISFRRRKCFTIKELGKLRLVPLGNAPVVMMKSEILPISQHTNTSMKLLMAYRNIPSKHFHTMTHFSITSKSSNTLKKRQYNLTNS